MSLIGKIVSKMFNVDYNDECKTCYALSAELERITSVGCNSCDTLRTQLDHALTREKELLNRLLQLTEPEKVPINIPIGDHRLNKTMPFRQALKIREEQDRLAASKLKSIADLEKELNITENKESELGEESDASRTQSGS